MIADARRGGRSLRVDDVSVVAPGPSVASPSASQAGPVVPPPGESSQGSGSLVFSDEFDASTLSTGKWTTRYPWPWHDGRSFDGEYQWYRDDRVSVQNGSLDINAVRGAVTGTDGINYPYTSGVVTTGGKFTFTYGLLEARVKVPKMAGPAWSKSGSKLWPAFWLCPAASYESGSSTYPEIDVFEFFGDSSNPATHFHYFDPETGADKASVKWYGSQGTDFGDRWAVWGLDWRPGLMRFLVDGTEVHRVEGASVPSQPMFIMLNMAVGKSSWGSPGPETPADAHMQVDWVRVTKL